MSIGRNDACPCGSGKKYKKCCGHYSVVSLNDIAVAEAVELQKQVTNYAISNYKEPIESFLDTRLKNFHIPEEFMEAFSFLMVNWYISTNKDEGKSIMERFIDDRLQTIQRPRVQNILKTWKEAKPSILKVLKSEKNQLVTEDMFSKEEVTVLTFNEARHVPVGSDVIGITIPFEEHQTFYTLYIDIPPNFVSKFEQTIQKWFEESGKESAVAFLKENYPEIVKLALLGEEGPLHIDEIEWVTPSHKDVAELFQRKVDSSMNPKIAVPVGMSLWYDYCKKENPRVRNKGIYAGALHLLVERLLSPNETRTFKEIGEAYEASASSISSRMKQMEEVLREHLKEWSEKLQDVTNEKEVVVK
ncbi:SEC-C metal-binding domain-containing protein [Bacillus sp. FJAT-47783]|uniref:SEC-C metal-binding domain-containing protein n=1 Tax=Bacillus sp. FJAT-47783 TaxID=2922712 RepID=UPI001FAD9718|nr:SEC-C metal-binding domain-containing protein [Bacillus sp. FJAT-47783]